VKPRDLAGRRRNPLVVREIFDSLCIKPSNPIQHFENIPVNLVAGPKKIVIRDFQPAFVHRQVPSIYDGHHIGSDGNEFSRSKGWLRRFSLDRACLQLPESGGDSPLLGHRNPSKRSALPEPRH